MLCADVDFDVTRYTPLQLQLLDRSGIIYPAGTDVAAFPSGERYIVGFDGSIELNEALGDDELRLTDASGARCFFTISQLDRSASAPTLRCSGVSLVMTFNTGQGKSGP